MSEQIDDDGAGDIEAWKEYTRRKNEWAEQHPQSTPEEYDAMIRALIDELGI